MSAISLFLTLFFAILGTAFVTLAAIGIIRMPDLYTRMQTSTKASTLGSICCMLAVAFYYQEVSVIFRVIGISIFLFLTAPIAAHVLCKAGVMSRIPMSDDHVINDLKDQFATGKMYDEA